MYRLNPVWSLFSIWMGRMAMTPHRRHCTEDIKKVALNQLPQLCMYSPHRNLPDFRFVFNEWNIFMVAWNWKPIYRYHIVRFLKLNANKEPYK